MTIYLLFVPWFLFIVGPPAILAWLICRWWRSSSRGARAWRNYPAIGLIALVGLSGLFWILSSVWIVPWGEVPFFSSLFRWFPKVEFLAAVIQWLLVMIGPPAILIWAMRQWCRSSLITCLPAWRRYFTLGAIILVALSDLLWVVGVIGTRLVGGLPYEGDWIWLVLFGLFAAPAGLLASLIGKGTPRWPTCSASIVVTLLWIASSVNV